MVVGSFSLKLTHLALLLASKPPSGYNTRYMNHRSIKKQEKLARTLLSRLEKISADSPWAHQASGIRASIAKTLSKQELKTIGDLESLLDLGFDILEKAAGEIPEE